MSIAEPLILKKGEVCEVTTFETGKTWAHLQSLNPNFKGGKWTINISKIALAPEMFQVLS